MQKPRGRAIALLLAAALSASASVSANGNSPQGFDQRSPQTDGRVGRPLPFTKKTAMAVPGNKTGLTLPRLTPRLSNGTLPSSGTEPSKATIFGCMISNDTWGYYDRPVGIYSINPVTGATGIKVPAAVLDEGQTTGTYAEGKFYASSTLDFYGTIFSITNITVDVETGEITTAEMTDLNYRNVSVNMSYDPNSGNIYSINYGDTTDDYTLCTFDPATNSYTWLCDLQDHYYAFCLDADSNMYGINDVGEVKLIDKATGAETATVASTNYVPNYLQSCCWSPTDNRIYWAACSYSTSALIAIDPATGLSETLVDFPNSEEFIGLYCTDPMVKPGAPAACGSLTVGYPEPGSAEATIRCTLPDVTADGSVLDGPVTFVLTIDGVEEVSTRHLSPGQVYTGHFTLAEGPHKITAFCSNSVGKGMPVTVKTFAGNDTPAPISDLTAEVIDDTTVRLAWSAPGAGAGGGWFDPQAISYDIERDGSVIAENIMGTAFSDVVSDELRSYEYRVRVMYRGAETSSQKVDVVAGRYAMLPYTNDFETQSSFGTLTLIDNNRDDNTWQWDEDQQAAFYNYSSDRDADDYMVLPKMKIEAGHVYNIAFTARSRSSSYPEKIEVVYGTSPDAEGLSTIIRESHTVPTDFTDYSERYEAGEDAIGYFALHCVSDADMSSLYVYNISVTDLGNVKAPKAPADFTAVPADGMWVDLSLTVPVETNDGSPLAAVSKVEILRDGTLIHTTENPAPGQTVTVSDEASFGFNTYTAIAYADGLAGVPATVKAFAGTYTLPFSIGPDPDEFTLFTVEPNPDVDDNEWYHDTGANALKISTYTSNDTDNFAFTPVVELGDANLVDLKFDACGMYDTEILEVTYGPTPDRSTHIPVGKIEINTTEFQTFGMSFAIPRPGRYHIGFRALSPARSTCISVRDIRMENGALMLAPGKVTDAVVEAAPAGQLRATVSFDVPDVDLKGNPLDGTVDILLLRADGSTAGTLAGAVPGSRRSIDDGSAAQGVNTYTLVTSNAYGPGASTTVSGWCGIDIPGAICDLAVLPTADNLGAVLSWTAPVTSVHDGYVDPAALTYNVYRLVNGRDLYKVGETRETTLTDYPSGAMDFHTYYVSASTEAGEGITSYTGVVVGPPAPLPMVETASHRVVTNLPWISGPMSGDVNWGVADYIGSIDLAPADGGMFVCSSALPARLPGAARMQLPKLVFGDVVAPTLTFSMYHYPGSGAELKVSVTTDEVGYDEVFAAATDGAAEGWKEYSVNLSEYSGKPWVAICFDGIISNGASYVIVDDIEVANKPEYDISIASVRGRSTAAVGETVPYLVEVRNGGRQHVPFSLSFTAGDKLIGTVTRDTRLPAGSSDIYRFEFTPEAEHLSEPVMVVVEAVPEGWTDEMPENNVAMFEVTVVQPEMPVVDDLAVACTGDGAELTWTEPSLVPAGFTDTFEDYDSFAYEEIGPYTLVDGDGMGTCGIMYVTFPNMGQRMAFQVWEPMAEGVDVDAEIWAPRSGTKCLVSWTALSTVEEPYNDDWLISPELYTDSRGGRFSFFAKRPVGDLGPETFQVLYSTTGTDTGDFSPIKTEIVTTGGWKEYSYDLPAGATHFAIRYISSDKFAMLFDDLTYTPQSATGQLRIEGYRVYRDGAPLADVDGTACSFTDTEAPANARYNVTVAYDRGESLMSNTVYLTTGLGDVEHAGISVTAARGYITVRNAEGRTVDVVAPDGSTVASSSDHGASLGISVSPGVYIVTVSGAGSVKISAR